MTDQRLLEAVNALTTPRDERTFEDARQAVAVLVVWLRQPCVFSRSARKFGWSVADEAAGVLTLRWVNNPPLFRKEPGRTLCQARGALRVALTRACCEVAMRQTPSLFESAEQEWALFIEHDQKLHECASARAVELERQEAARDLVRTLAVRVATEVVPALYRSGASERAAKDVEDLASLWLEETDTTALLERELGCVLIGASDAEVRAAKDRLHTRHKRTRDKLQAALERRDPRLIAPFSLDDLPALKAFLAQVLHRR
jgi:hypothetical protein